MSDKSEPAKTKPGFFRRLFTRTDEAPASAETTAPIEIVPDAAPDGPIARELAALDEQARGDDAISSFLLPPRSDPPAAPPPPVAPEPQVQPEAPAPAPRPAPAVEPPPPEVVKPEVLTPEVMAPDMSVPEIEEPDLVQPEGAPREPAPVLAEPTLAEPGAAKRSWWTRLRDGLARSSSSIGTGISDIFTKRKLDDAMLEDLEDVLIRADLGVATATRISEAVGKGRFDKAVTPEEVKAVLAGEVERVLSPYAKPIAIDARKPFVILVVGVNGSGKTTTIGKLAAKFTGEGKRVMLAAGDTFRAAAIAQLTIWGERFGCAVVAREQGSDAAGLAYEAIEQAREQGADILLMDTAGRLQNRTELMAELEKIIRVMRKLEAEAPHAVLLVLDATVGQNAMSQVEIFGKVAGVTGLVMTKLDGTARGGILVAITEKFKLPVHFVGVGETADDLEPFAARDFAEAIAGIERRA